MGFMAIYLATADIFPTLFCGTAFGVCYFFSSLISVLAPMVAEIKEPLPIVIFVSLNIIGFGVSLGLIPKKE
jgi:hypothetical protein